MILFNSSELYMQGVSYRFTVNKTWYEKLDTLKGKDVKSKGVSFE